VAAGVAAEANLYDWSEPGKWLPDLLTGWALIACGLAARGRPGLLLTASGFAWFAGNLTSIALLLHRAPLAQLVVAYPGGRAQGRLERGAIAGAYAISIGGAIWYGHAATFALAALVLLVTGRSFLQAVALRRRQRAYAARAAALFALVLAVGPIADLIRNTGGERSVMLHVYQAGLVALGLFILYGLLRQPWQQPGIVDLVVELGDTRTGSVRAALANALGDSTLDVAYRVDGGYVDAAGRPVSLPEPTDGRRLTRIGDVAVLVHDAAVLDDPALLDAVGAATRLAAANARLQAEVRAQVTELEASRRRLLAVGDDERRRLEESLRAGALRRLTRLDALLGEVHADEAREQLARTASELSALAAGLHPRELVEHGLAAALEALAARSPIPVDLAMRAQHLPDDVELTVFYVCSEALTNVWKHANASRVSIAVERETSAVNIDVRDDGIGGAEPRSLADRVDAAGGRLDIDSPPGGGTHLTARVPL
jgi:signal transduction histidine kinase